MVMDERAHNLYMGKALRQATVGFSKEEVPVGAVIVGKDGRVLSRAHNQIEKKGCQTAHAEVLAINKACRKVGDWRLDDCWLYVTLEPCLMCFGLIKLSRMKGVVFGAKSSLFGIGFGREVGVPLFYKKDLLVVGGVREDECCGILKEFFRLVRKKHIKKDK
jgi:tRNA(adenine34) deaminase